MLRNKEFRRMFLFMLCITAIFGAIMIQMGVIPTILSVLLGVLLMGVTIYYSQRRYKDIEQLSDYLKKIYNGNYALDIRDNAEGELSILKNEIYKVTLILSKQAEQMQKEKEQLGDALSDISHQLKTPLTSMMVMSELLEDDHLDFVKRREFTKKLLTQLERMEWLLTSLLKLSKIDAGTIKFKKEHISVSNILEKAITPLMIPMELKNQKLRIEGDVLIRFIGDMNWTVEAFVNIIKNCIEHTPEGGDITIRYEDNPICTKIVISDSGYGIPKEELPYVFKRFFRGKNATQDSVGIGLAMAKSILTSQNGDIFVTNGSDCGVEFTVKFYKQNL